MTKTANTLQKALALWGGVLIAWSLYLYSFPQSTLVVDEFIVKPIFFLLPTLLFVTRYEHRALTTGLWLPSLQNKRSWGIFAGCVVALLVTAVVVGSMVPSIGVPLALTFALASLAVGISQETLSCGLVVVRLWEDNQNMLKTLIYGTALQLILHIPRLFTNPAISGHQVLYALGADILVSFVITAAFLWRRDLRVAIGVRVLYSFVLLVLLQS